MDNKTLAEKLALLYMQTKASASSPADFAAEYKNVLKEIENHLDENEEEMDWTCQTI